MEEKKEQILTIELAKKRIQEIHNSMPTMESSQLSQWQREMKFFEGWMIGYQSKENEIKNDKKPELKVANK